MPRYFFHLHDDVDVEDEEGQELPDLDAARKRGERYALDMTAASVLETRKVNLHHRIDVANESGEIVCTVAFGDVLTIEGG